MHTLTRNSLRTPRRLPRLVRLLAAFVLATEPSALATAAENETCAPVEILRDPWGIPHIFAATDAGAFHGLGYATAEDRAFQMTYSLRIIQGRLAETVGEVRMMNRNETSLDSDRKMRTFGFHRAARRTAENLDPETRALLQAYCDGVNDYFAQHREDLHPLFARLGVKPEPWTPADCLASWWHLGQFFATDGTRELIAGRNAADSGQGRPARGQGRPGLPGRDANRPALPADIKPMPADDSPAVVKRADVTTDWIERVEGYAREHGLQAAGDGAEGPKFSHAWVVGGQRTTTGSSVLVSDPQTPVRNPSLFYEFHLQGETFNARGIGVPGSPIILIGFTEQVAWGVTALGADQADLFLLETDPAQADQYRFDGHWRSMTAHRETILVKGGNPIELAVRETHLGPVATAFCFAQPGDGEVALKRIPVCETNRETIQGAIAMMRARNASEFHTALSGWQFPSVNLLFGDREGNIGYRAAAAIPVRSREDADGGRKAMPGRTTKHDWQEMLPGDLLPQVSNPKAGFLYSGNHRPIESWYPLPLGAMTGAGGDTVRSWRLRERLEAKTKFSPEEVRDIHHDTVNPARRDIVRIALHLRDVLGRELSNEARQALAHLEPWYRAGASSALASQGAELATELNTFFRFMNTDLALVYGGGESGLAYFLKTAAARLVHDPQADFSPVEQAYLDQVLAGAWQSAQQKYGEDSSAWNDRARQVVRERRLGYLESLDGFPSLDRALDLPFPALTDVDGGTIASQASQSYTQWVPMHDPDQAQSILPIGQSERPGSPSRTSTMGLWSEGRLHPAPLSRAKVEQLGVSRTTVAARTNAPVNAGPSRGNEAVNAEGERSLPKPPATPERRSDPSAELAKWDDADKHRSQTGPGGTGWDSQYRSLIQTDESATSKGFPTHAEAAQQILADAATSPDNLLRHKLWVLYIKHFSQAYRPDSATADLKRLYEDLVAMESGGAARKPTLPFDNDPRLTIHRDVIYGKFAPELQRMDAYLVKSDHPTPVLIEFHGGGWRRGAKSQFTYSAGLIEAILAADISVISVDYRLTPKHPFPAQVEDAARAVQFVRSKAKEWNLDPERIVAMGGSAGAHLSAWVALHDDLARLDSPDPVERHSTRVRGCVDLWGPMDLTRVRPTELARTGLRGADFADAFTGAFACTAEAYERDPDVRRRVREVSPLFLVTRDDPPALIVHAAGEDMAPGNHPPIPEIINDPHSAWHGVLLADAMREAGLEVVCRIGPEVGRNAQEDNAAIVDFLRRRILPPTNQPETE